MDHSRRSQSLLVHDSEAVDIQGRGCHPRGQAKGSQCWAHIEQSPLKLQEDPENSFSVCPGSSSRPQAGSVRQSQRSAKVEPAAVEEDKCKRMDGQEVMRARAGGILVKKNTLLESLQSKWTQIKMFTDDTR